MTPPASLYLVTVRGYKGKKISGLKWPEMTWTKGCLFKLHLDHHHLPEIWPSLRFRVVNDETSAVPTENCLWIVILDWKKCLVKRSVFTSYWGQDDEILRKFVKLWKYYTENFTATSRFSREAFTKNGKIRNSRKAAISGAIHEFTRYSSPSPPITGRLR